MGFVLNHSGNVFSRLTPTLRDVACNAEACTLMTIKPACVIAVSVYGAFKVCLQAVFAIIKAYHSRGLRFSAYSIQKGILMFYTQARLFPPGLASELPCVQSWSLRCAYALRRLVACLSYSL